MKGQVAGGVIHSADAHLLILVVINDRKEPPFVGITPATVGVTLEGAIRTQLLRHCS